MNNLEIWAHKKKIRELSQEIEGYEIRAQAEIDNNKVAREDKVRDNRQRRLQVCYKNYRDYVGENYPNPKFEIED
jgi:hypothetical protein